MSCFYVKLHVKLWTRKLIHYHISSGNYITVCLLTQSIVLILLLILWEQDYDNKLVILAKPDLFVKFTQSSSNYGIIKMDAASA